MIKWLETLDNVHFFLLSIGFVFAGLIVAMLIAAYLNGAI